MMQRGAILSQEEWMIFADLALARRLEAAEAAVARGTSAQPGSALLEAAGGCAIFAGAESPLTHAVAMGLGGPVRPAVIDEIECFFRSRGAKVTMDVCPLADAAFVAELARRGYRVTEFNNVLVRRLAGHEPAPAPRARPLSPGEEDGWAPTVGRGFFEHADLTGEEMDIGRAIARMPEALCYFAATQTGPVAAGGAMAIHGGVAAFFADGTIPVYRREGMQRELIAARLNDAAALGCDLATASTLPGTGSQRNYERMAFQVAYTKVTMVG
jgi:hypothetical protein